MITAMSRADREPYRRALRGYAADPIAERLFGTEPCLSCTRVVSLAVLIDGYCPACRRPRATRPAVALELDDLDAPEPGCVYVDASWHRGVAGLAVVGALGAHSRRVDSPSNVAAEVEALRWALRLAKAIDASTITFRTDSESAARYGARAVPRGRAWVVEWVPRRHNRLADRLSRAARLA
jgi:hypothetical protein